MLCYLPEPYPDELLYSVIARYCTYMDLSIARYGCSIFEKKNTLSLRADLPRSLQNVSDKTYFLWGLTSAEILNKMTMYPYYEPFLPKNVIAEKKKGYIQGGHGAQHQIGVNSYRVSSPKFLRFCPVCRGQDLEKFGETYWHRKHQLPGALVCPEHFNPLINSSAVNYPRQRQCCDAIIFTSDDLTADTCLDANELFLAGMVAERCQNILLKKYKSQHMDNLAAVYRDAALERGFYKLPGIFSSKRFESAFMEFYGNSFLEKIGINIKSDWIRLIFYDNPSQPVHPLEHILVQLYLEHMPVIASMHPFGRGPWKCPNPFGAH